MKYVKGKRIQVTTIDGQVVRGKVYGVINARWGRKRKAEPTLRIERRDTLVAIPLRNIKTRKKKRKRR